MENNPQFVTIKSLGSGAQADVKLCHDLNTQKKFALKTFEQCFASSVTVELACLSRLARCSNVAQLYHINIPFHIKKLSIPLHLYENGDLFNFLDEIGPLEESMAKFIFKMCLRGIQETHGRDIVHGDIKPENIFFDSNYEAVIGDFAMATLLESDPCTGLVCPLCDDYRGTRDYMAPEIISSSSRWTRYDGLKADVWSLGCLFFVMLFGYHPFGEGGADPRTDWYFKAYLNKREEFWQIHADNLSPRRISDEVRCVLERFLDPSPDTRSSVHELIEDAYFKAPALAGIHKENQLSAAVASARLNRITTASTPLPCLAPLSEASSSSHGQ
jgi:serine/threonine protein kinase